MRKTFLFLIIGSSILFSAKITKAQFNYIGGGIALATGGEYRYEGYSYYNKSFGIDIRASYDYSKKVKFVPDFKIYLPNKEKFVTGGESSTTVFVFNLNMHYILNSKSRGSNYKLYLLAGAHVGAWHITNTLVTVFGSTNQLDINEFKFVPGANAGAGMQFPLGNRIMFYAEAKYVIAKAHQFVFSPGLLYEF